MAVSSAKVAIVVFSECGISDVKMLNSVGAKMLPWGTPALGKWIWESLSSQRTAKERLDGNDLIVRNKGAGRERILWRRPSCQTRSNV